MKRQCCPQADKISDLPAGKILRGRVLKFLAPETNTVTNGRGALRALIAPV